MIEDISQTGSVLSLAASSSKATKISRVVEEEIVCVTEVQREDLTEIVTHCDDLERCLLSLGRHRPWTEINIQMPGPEDLKEKLEKRCNEMSGKFNLEETSLVEVPKVLDVHNLNVVPRVRIEEVIRTLPKVVVQERVKSVPKVEVQVVERVVEVPCVQYAEKIIEVPQIRRVEKVVEVPQVQIQEIVKHVPVIQVQEVIRHVPKVEVQEVVRAVPKIDVQVVDKIIEVPILEIPKIQTVEKIVHVPQVLEKVVEVDKYIPQLVKEIVEVEKFVPQVVKEIVEVEKLVPVPQIEYVQVPQLVDAPRPIVKEVVAEVQFSQKVLIGDVHVPIIQEAQLKTMQSDSVRDHAFLLYKTLGHARIGSAAPVAGAELIEWILMVQQLHVEPFRTTTAFGPPRSARTFTASPLPMAVAGVDTSGDGQANLVYIGADKTGNGIPDSLQWSQARPLDMQSPARLTDLSTPALTIGSAPQTMSYAVSTPREAVIISESVPCAAPAVSWDAPVPAIRAGSIAAPITPRAGSIAAPVTIAPSATLAPVTVLKPTNIEPIASTVGATLGGTQVVSTSSPSSTLVSSIATQPPPASISGTRSIPVTLGASIVPPLASQPVGVSLGVAQASTLPASSAPALAEAPEGVATPQGFPGIAPASSLAIEAPAQLASASIGGTQTFASASIGGTQTFASASIGGTQTFSSSVPRSETLARGPARGPSPAHGSSAGVPVAKTALPNTREMLRQVNGPSRSISRLSADSSAGALCPAPVTGASPARERPVRSITPARISSASAIGIITPTSPSPSASAPFQFLASPRRNSSQPGGGESSIVFASSGQAEVAVLPEEAGIGRVSGNSSMRSTPCCQ